MTASLLISATLNYRIMSLSLEHLSLVDVDPASRHRNVVPSLRKRGPELMCETGFVQLFLLRTRPEQYRDTVTYWKMTS